VTGQQRPTENAPSGSLDAGDSARAGADHIALADSLMALEKLSKTKLDLTEMLTKVATFAVHAIPGADGAGLTLLEIDRADLIVKSEPFVRAIDDIQYGIGEGPCISAAATGQTKRSGQLSADPRWPQFGRRASELGVHSALSLPLVVSDRVLGAMNVYAHKPDSFDDHAQRMGEVFAVSAALAVQNAQILEQTARLVTELQAGLKGRALIDQAIGVLRRRGGDTAEEAQRRLREMSADQQISLSAAAASVVDSAIKRGRIENPGSADPQK
jgi:GAF domain-containing protein